MLKKTDLLFVLMLLGVAVLYDYPGILMHRPYSTHQWRQCDCLSITYNYYKENRGFFEPAIHWVGDGKDGKTVSECPIIYYTVAQLWKVFGYHEFILRLINTLIVFTGLFSLYRLILDFLKDDFWAIIITLFLFTSPILVYYTNNFTADAPAFGLALISLSLYWNGYKKQNRFLFYFASFTFLLAGLIKISSLLSFFAVVLIHLYTIITQKNKKGWFYKWYSLLPYLFTLIGVFAWYRFAQSYNQKNISGVFLTGLFPIWKLNSADINRIWISLKDDLSWNYFNVKALLSLFIFYAVVIFFIKRNHKLLISFTTLILLGIIGFLLLFYQAFDVHDYYLTNLLIFIPFPFMAFIVLIKSLKINRAITIFYKILVIFFLTLLVYETAIINRLKYRTNDPIIRSNFLVGKNFINKCSWYHWYYEKYFKSYETITPYLRSLGINRNDRVVSLSDMSFNITLYLMDQKGFAGWGYNDLTWVERMQLYERNQMKYMISDTSYLQQNNIGQYFKQKKGEYKNLVIYEIEYSDK